eukprot:8817315-Karenia_brevis.AAC.1
MPAFAVLAVVDIASWQFNWLAIMSIHTLSLQSLMEPAPSRAFPKVCSVLQIVPQALAFPFVLELLRAE